MLTILPYLLQEIPDGVTDAALSANPWNTAAYGLLVVVLMAFSYLNYRDRRSVEKEYFKYMATTIELLAKVEVKMTVLTELRSLFIDHIQSPPKS